MRTGLAGKRVGKTRSQIRDDLPHVRSLRWNSIIPEKRPAAISGGSVEVTKDNPRDHSALGRLKVISSSNQIVGEGARPQAEKRLEKRAKGGGEPTIPLHLRHHRDMLRAKVLGRSSKLVQGGRSLIQAAKYATKKGRLTAEETGRCGVIQMTLRRVCRGLGPHSVKARG